MAFKDVLKREREKRGWTQDFLAEKMGVAPSTVGMWEQGERIPKNKNQEDLADIFNVGLDYLMGRSSHYTALLDDKSSRSIRIPVLGEVAAGIPLEMIEDIVDYEEIPAEWGSEKDFFALRIQGKSMLPKIDEGDIVIVRKQDDADSGDIVIVTVNGDSATCKRLKKDEHGIMLVPLNSSFDPISYNWEDVKKLPVAILGRVVELRSKF